MNAAAMPSFVNPDTMPTPPGYSQVVQAAGGRTVYVAGQVALDKHGQLVGAGELAAQVEQVFRNLEAAMAACGGDMSNVIKLTTFLLDIGGLATFRDVRDRFIAPGERVPASTLVEVSALFRPEFLVEIEAIAWFPT